jgi:hypothetical protein
MPQLAVWRVPLAQSQERYGASAAVQRMQFPDPRPAKRVTAAREHSDAAGCAATIVTRRAETGLAAPVAGPYLRVERDRPQGRAARQLLNQA